MMNDDDILLLPSNDTGRTSLAYGASHPVAPQARPEGLRRLHQLLRGRYSWAVVLGLICGGAGAFLGYRSQQPAFRARELLDFHMTLPDVRSNQEPLIQGYSYMVNTQIRIMTSPENIKRAMDRQEWKEMGRSNDDQAVEDFANNLDVEQSPGSEIVEVSFTDLDENAARAGVKALCNAYQAFLDDQDPIGLRAKYKYWEDRRTLLRTDLANQQTLLDNLTKTPGTDQLESVALSAVMKREQLREAWQQELYTFQLVQDAYDRQQNEKPTTLPTSLSIEQIGLMDPEMSRLLDNQAELQRSVADFANVRGENNPQTQLLRQKVLANQADIQAEAVNFKNQHKGLAYSPSATQPTLRLYTQADVDQAKANADNAHNQFLAQDDYANELSRRNHDLIQARNNVAMTNSSLAEANQHLDDLNSEMRDVNTGQFNLIEVLSKGNPLTEKTNDKRRTMGIVGGMLGAAIPTMLLLMLGLIDSRFRYSDEANGEMSGAPLLGILPNLPDLLTDPAQAAIAAHCVHQIRTLLQINGSTFGRNVFAITSASPGDGKTSLTLALGLSFAASGSRTLLIDCDLVGAGLTARLNVHSPQGVLEAMANRKVLEYVHSTDVADLSILPVGESLGGYTGTVSPGAIRRLVDGARAHFDTILIDTGPVLGSIEASPVAVAADATILCVSRGQQRPLVDKAMALLASIGARMAGVVFNRAQAQDFQQSISRMSQPAGSSFGRKKQTGELTGDSPFGPVAKAVASSVKSNAGSNGK